MKQQTLAFSSKKVDYLFDASFAEFIAGYDPEKIIIITDEHVFEKHETLFTAFKTIRVSPGEAFKTQDTIDTVIEQLLQFDADKTSVIAGVGGGVVTDMAGYAASIFKRGTRLIQVPTSILAMVDAAVGGKNGVDVGLYKNMVGTIYQPEAVLFDFSFLKTLPEAEWINGFAEVIKHACIKDAELFAFLESHSLRDFIDGPQLIADLIEKNVGIKTGIVLSDEFEQGDRKLLNFGHTIGHAIENIHVLPHGAAISVGMVAAAELSVQISSLSEEEQHRIERLLAKYGLPTKLEIDKEAVWDVLLKDKKRDKQMMNFILLDRIGNGIIRPIPLDELKVLIDKL